MPFGFFGKKDKDEKPAAAGSTPAAEGSGDGDRVRSSPENAAKFFNRARDVHDATNFEYAAQLWLSGLRWDPASMSGLEGFFRSMAALMREKPKGPDRELYKMFEGRGEVDKFLAALLAFGVKPTDAAAAVRAAEAASKLGLAETTHWVGNAALNVVRGESKPKKDLAVRLKDAFSKVQAYDKAVEAGELAVRLDPSDGALATEVKNLAAQATMSSGGYEQTGQAGGFRANVRDLEKQRRLEEADRVVKSEDAVDRLLSEARADYERRPTDLPAITLYIKRLLERGKDEDEKSARDIARKAYADTREFRFRETEGDINLRRAARKLLQYKEAAAKSPQDATAQENWRKAREQFVRMELEEFRLRIEAYPTEPRWKFESAKRLLELGSTDEAIPLLQEAQQDARYRVEAFGMLGQAFLKIDYIDEAIHAYRQALEAHKITTDETGMALNYGLLTALQLKAEKDRDAAAAGEADKIASAIALQQFNYRDIRARRDAIKKLVAELRGPG